eukprot:m.27301 g.27301  ORF g.27301 m.27301 type:complete len:78 (+) comp5928_c2_seq2:93-326(+)
MPFCRLLLLHRISSIPLCCFCWLASSMNNNLLIFNYIQKKQHHRKKKHPSQSIKNDQPIVILFVEKEVRKTDNQAAN